MHHHGRFSLGETLLLEETRHLELKEVKSTNAVRAIVDVADEYAVAFLNSEGGRVLWGIRDADKTVVGVELIPADRDRLRRDITGKLGEVQPQLDPSRFKLTIHPVINGGPNLVVIELEIPAGQSTKPFYTGSHECFVRADGVKKKLSGQQLTDWILSRATNAPADHTLNPALGQLAQRVRRVLSGHGLQPAHLARFFKVRRAPFSITLADQQNDAAFLQWLDEDKIDWIARTFGVRREWIDGEDERIFEHLSYDRDPVKFLSTISLHADQLVFEDIHDSPDAWFIRHGVGKEWGARGHARVFVIVRVPLARFSNEVTIYRYLSDFSPYPWDEGRTAVQLRAWARLLAVSKGIHCWGREVSHETGDKIWSNSVFLHEVLSDYQLVHRCRSEWHPEDCALYPEESAVAAPDAFFSAVIDFLKSHRLPYEKTRLFGPDRAPPPKASQ